MIKVTKSKHLSYLGAAVHQGQCVKGVQKAPQIIRQSGLFDSLKNKFQVTINDLGDISAAVLQKQVVQGKKVEHHVKNLHILSPVLQKISNAIYTEVTENPQNIMLTIGGDHSVATGTISGLMRKYQNLKVVWVDAHPDFIDTQKSDYYGYHGIPLAHLTGLSKFANFQWLKKTLPIQNFVLIGIRDIDRDEWISLKQQKVKCFTMDHVDKFGIGEVMRQAIQYLDPKGQSPFHVSFDIDAIDPSLVSATGTRFRGGLSHRQSCHIIRRVAQQRKLVGLDVVQINDQLCSKAQRQAFRGEENLKSVSPTVGMGIDLIESMFTNYLEL